MGEEKNEKCTLENCAIKDHIDFIVDQFKEIADRLTQNHIELRMSVVKLTENMKYVQRIHDRIDSIEEKLIKENKELRAKVEESDEALRQKIDQNNAMLYKIIGAFGIIALIVPWVLDKIFK